MRSVSINDSMRKRLYDLKSRDASLQNTINPMENNPYKQRAKPLSMLSENEEATIAEIRGGRGLVRRLLDMGFTYGTKIKMLHSSSSGPVLVSLRGSRVALGRGVTMKIYVKMEE